MKRISKSGEVTVIDPTIIATRLAEYNKIDEFKSNKFHILEFALEDSECTEFHYFIENNIKYKISKFNDKTILYECLGDKEDIIQVEYLNGDTFKYKDGKFHSDNGASVIIGNNKCFHKNGILNKDDGPAVIRDGIEEFWKDDQILESVESTEELIIYNILH